MELEGFGPAVTIYVVTNGQYLHYAACPLFCSHAHPSEAPRMFSLALICLNCLWREMSLILQG